MTEEQLQLREELRVECKFGNLERINKLIELGADLNWGLHGACEGGHLSIVNLMIKLGANQFFLYFACMSGNLTIVDRLVELGGNEFNSGLYAACRYGHFLCAKKMRILGATFKENDHKKWYNDQIKIEEMLINYIGSDLTELIFEY